MEERVHHIWVDERDQQTESKVALYDGNLMLYARYTVTVGHYCPFRPSPGVH